MMQEVERMSKLSNKDRELLQSIQEGVSGVRPITPEWINNIVKSLKERPVVFKQMLKGKGSALGGMSDEQIESYIDMGSGMSEFFLQCIAFGIWYLTKAMKPLSELYTTIDKYTFNSARYIFLAFLLPSKVDAFAFTIFCNCFTEKESNDFTNMALSGLIAALHATLCSGQ